MSDEKEQKEDMSDEKEQKEEMMISVSKKQDKKKKARKANKAKKAKAKNEAKLIGAVADPVAAKKQDRNETKQNNSKEE